ncbi:MAG: S1 family peptidase [bacterium]
MGRVIGSTALGLVVLLCLGGTACVAEQPSQTRRAILDGERTLPGQYPATGGLVLDGEIFCTGTLVASNAVLTAAHCIDPVDLGTTLPKFTLVHDEADITLFNVYQGRAVRIHPGYVRDSGVTSPGLVNDIGILLLVMDVEDVTPELIATPEEAAEALTAFTDMEIVGYGWTSMDEAEAGVKHHGVTPLRVVGAWELQLGWPGGPQPCYGDSGGPIFYSLPGGDRRIVGVVSRGPGEEPGCDDGAIATRADSYGDWVESVAGEGTGCAVAGRSPAPLGTVLVLLFGAAALGWGRRRRYSGKP